MLNFKRQSDGKIEADPGSFDDRVIDMAIGRYTMKSLPYTGGYFNHFESAPSGLPGSGAIQTRPDPKAYY
jgi:hypothetical protein